MTKISTSISLDPKLKKEANALFNEFGLDLSTAISIFLKQTVREKRIPFDITLNYPNKETIKALNEFEEMKKDKQTYKRYDSFNDSRRACSGFGRVFCKILYRLPFYALPDTNQV